jgi:hypothetical protein
MNHNQGESMINHEKRHCLCRKSASLISGLVLGIIAVVHLIRSFMGWTILINGTELPIWASILTVIITGAIAIWDFCGCCNKNCQCNCHRGVKNEPPHVKQL